MAAFQPTDQDIETFLSMVPDLSRSQVIARLKGNNNNVDQAVNEYFDNIGGPNKYEWDESVFEADRDGPSTTQGPEFKIQAADDIAPYGGRFDGGPSRPPSRISNNKFARDPSSYDQGDRDLHEALAASAREAGLPPQESGITSTDQVHFGPANRSQYEPGKWDLVPTVGAQAAVYPDPEPAERKRDVNTPAFLKPTADDHRLGALLTIYHQIPLMREIMLDRKNILSSYGNNNEWWAGRAIEVPGASGSEASRYPVGQEIQRLMAFLDKTDRSYGSAEALANLPAVKEQWRQNGDCVEVSVMRAFRDELGDSDSAGVIKKLFSVGVAGNDHSDSEEFCILRFDLPPKDSDQETFYDVADSVLWHLEPLDISKSSYLAHIADVIAFQLVGNSSSKGVEIPYVWYPDRYMESSRQAALDMRVQKAGIRDTLRRIDAQCEWLTHYTMPGNKKVKVKDLLGAVIQQEVDENVEEGCPSSNNDTTREKFLSGEPSATAKKLAMEVQKLMASIDKKLIALNDEREKAKNTLRDLSKLYTEPLEDPDQPALHRYTLRGISTSKSTTYISTQAEPDLIDMDLNKDHASLNGDQWWKIVYPASGSTSFSVEKTTLEDALEAAKCFNHQDGNIILTYASEKAMSWERKPLPKALETFVRYDNALFRSEFPSDVASPTISPGKRKFDSSTEDSPESSRWGSTGNARAEHIVSVNEREVDPETEEGSYGHREEQPEVIEGVDPFTDDRSEAIPQGLEMKERKSMRMLPSRSRGSAEPDLVAHDPHVAEESGAVKHLGLK